jgi:autotransporter-associated beta strand protein
MRASFFLLLSSLLAGSLAAISPPTFYWQGDDSDDPNQNWTHGPNWENGVVPNNDGTAIVSFGNLNEDEDDPEHVQLDSIHDVFAMTFEADAFYSFSSFYGSSTLTIQDSLSIENSYDAEVFFNYDVTVNTTGDIDFMLGSGSEVEISGELNLAATDTLTVSGGGALLLSGDNTTGENLDGTLHILNGFLGVGHDDALGGVLVELGDSSDPGENVTGIVAVDGDRSIGNDILVHGHLQTEEDDDDDNELNLEGTVTLTADTLINNYGGLLNFAGVLTEANSGTKLTIDADEPVLFTGSTSFTGGLHMNEGMALFGSLGAIPTVGSFTSSNNSTYIGLMIAESSDRLAALTALLARFDPTGYNGTIGFDTDPGDSGALYSYGGNIDLTGLTAERIGSLTIAELTGTITPSGSNYTFGGGNGTLLIGSLLTDDGGDPRGIDVTSFSYDPLTVFINNSSNSFTGPVNVTHSAIIFGDVPGALPTGVMLNPYTGGYIGLQDATRSIASYLAQFNPGLSQGIIGFDGIDRNNQRTITDAIDLSGFNASSPDFAIGTATNVKLTGPITLPGASDTYRFTAFKGGFLEVASTLTDGDGPQSVVIGDNNSSGAHGHEPAGGDETHSSVRLSNANTYTGGTTLESGQLLLGHSSALGTGTLTVDGPINLRGDVLPLDDHEDYFFFEPFLNPGLVADANDLIVTNPVMLQSSLTVHSGYDGSDRNLTLSGIISGYGGLVKEGSGTLTLGAANNTFQEGLYVVEGTVNLSGDNSIGEGFLGFGGGYGQTVNFLSMNPVVGGIFDYFEDEYSYSSSMISLATGSTLTIDVNSGRFEYGGTISGDAAVRITGEGQQRFTGFNSFTGGLQIADGANVVAGGYSSLGSNGGSSPVVTLDGGSLTLDGDPQDESSGALNAQIIFGPDGGDIRGNGTLTFTSNLQIGDGVHVSPGNSVGAINFNGPLEFGELGSMTVEIGEDETNQIITDVVFANSLNITANSTGTFSIFLQGENGSMPLSFDPMQAYSWSIAIASQAITGFDQLAFNLSLSSALQAIDGTWTFALGDANDPITDSPLTDNALMLTFTPVPEPSTAALLGLGLVMIGFQTLRRRPASRQS